MLKKLLITLKYGEKKAKIIIIGVFILLGAGIGLMVLGFLKSYMIPFGAGALMIIAGLLTLFSFSFVDIDVDIDNKNRKKEKAPVEKKEPETPKDDLEIKDEELDFSMFAEDLSDVAIGVGGISIQEGGKSEEKIDESEEDGKQKKKTKKKKKDSEDEISGNTEDISQEEYDEFFETPDMVKVKPEKTFEVKKPTPKQIKARKKMLKVRKNDIRFTPIIVDLWKSVSAMRVPAFVQDRGKTANIILVEGALRTELMPMQKFLEVTYQKNVEEKFLENYEEIKKDPDVDSIFGDLLPAFYPGGGRGGQQITCKNLYVLGGEMAITPRSLRKLFNKFDFNFKIFDSLDIKGDYSVYFKQAYENRIFWTDNVINQNDYQERIRTILQTMVEDKNLLNIDFEKDLLLMVRYNLITKEYADYYKARKNDKIRIRI